MQKMKYLILSVSSTGLSGERLMQRMQNLILSVSTTGLSGARLEDKI